MFAVIGRGCSGIHACGKRDFFESVCVRVNVMFAVIGRGCSGINACGKRDFFECVCACLRNVCSHR